MPVVRHVFVCSRYDPKNNVNRTTFRVHQCKTPLAKRAHLLLGKSTTLPIFQNHTLLSPFLLDNSKDMLIKGSTEVAFLLRKMLPRGDSPDARLSSCSTGRKKKERRVVTRIQFGIPCVSLPWTRD